MLRRTSRRTLIARRADEQGSIIIAIMLLLVTSALAATLAARTIGNGLIIVNRDRSASALGVAEAGVADALFRIDQGASSTFCVSPTVTSCVATSIPAVSGVAYEATDVSSTQWTVDSTGTYHGQTVAVQERLTRTELYPFALFGNTGLNFNGNSSNGFGTYAPGGTSVNTNGAVDIGSNGTISCNGGLGSNVTSVYYTGGGGVSGSCGTTQGVATRYNLTVPSAPASGTYQPCPNSGNLGSNNSYSSIAGNTYLCTTPVTIDGNLTVSSGTVNLYIILSSSTYNSSTAALTITANSNVNFGSTLPDATKFQVFSNSNGTFGNSNGQGYNFGGIIDAPNASLTADGCKSNYYGAIIINTLTCNGGPHLGIYYDSQLVNDYGPWSVTGYLQIPPSSVTIH